MEETAALLGSTAIKKRLAGVTGLLEQLRKGGGAAQWSSEDLALLIPHVLPCLRDNNSKIALSALEILELVLARVPETTVRAYLKLLWTSLVERLGDNKLHVREKAVDAMVSLSLVLDVSFVFEKLRACTRHKNWRAREQTLHAIWRCLEQHDLFLERKDELLDDVLRLLEDSSKEVRDSAVRTLEKFYAHIGSSLLDDLEGKNIRGAHMKTLTDKFQRIPAPAEVHVGRTSQWEAGAHQTQAPVSGSAAPDELSSILSSYDLQVSSSSSMARYLESVRSRTLNEAKAAAATASGERSPSQASSTSSKTARHTSSAISGDLKHTITEKEIQKLLSSVEDKLESDNNWSKRVDGLKTLQKLAQRCDKADNRDAALSSLSFGLRTVRERLCAQVNDLRSSVSREACTVVQTLASVLRDAFDAHAEVCLASLLKQTVVTINVISTAADSTIRSMLESTSNGYARVIPKLMECVRSTSGVLRYNAVCYLTLTLQRWSVGVLSKHSELFVPVMPSLLRDAIGDVRAQSRKCYWAYHYLFPTEAEGIFARLDPSTQKNVRDDSSRHTAGDARGMGSSSSGSTSPQEAEPNVRPAVARKAKPQRASAPESSKNAQPTTSSAQRVSASLEAPPRNTGKPPPVSFGPRRVLGSNVNPPSGETTEESSQSSRLLSRGPMRVGLATRAKTAASSDVGSDSGQEKKKQGPQGPQRVRSAPKAPSEAVLSSRQEASGASFHTSSSQSVPSRPQRVQRPPEPQAPAAMEVHEGHASSRPKRLQAASSPSPAKSSGSNTADPPTELSNSRSKPATAKQKERPRSASSPPARQDQLEDILRRMESNSWSTRLEAVESIGKRLGKQLNQLGDADQVDGRIVGAFIRHMSDPHYRVAQGVLKHFLPLLQLLAQHQQLFAQLKAMLPKLFHKFVDTKESVRTLAKENLEFVASAFESSTLASVLLPMLGDGSNMKVKAAMCHYLRELLPGAQDYMRQGANNSHMRAFLLKMVLLTGADSPVSVTSACGELVSIAAKLYGAEMENALVMLPPSKRSAMSKLLKSRRIVLNYSSSQRQPAALSAASRSTRSRDGDSDNQAMDTAVDTAEKPELERSVSRKRAESPNANSSSPSWNSQKRITTNARDAASFRRPEDAKSRMAVIMGASPDETARYDSHASVSSALLASSAGEPRKPVVQLEDAIHVLEENNATEAARRSALSRTLHFVEVGSSTLWDELFGRLLLLLLDAAVEKDVKALKVLQRLVETHPARAQPYFEPVLTRLLDAFADQVDVARHLVERTLRALVSAAEDHRLTLRFLTPLVSTAEPPTLQVALHLVKVCLEACEHALSQSAAFLRTPEDAEGLLRPLTQRLDHSSSSVRKSVVDCLVAFHFAAKEDASLLSKHLSAELDDTRKRLVEIFIDRAKMERHHALSS